MNEREEFDERQARWFRRVTFFVYAMAVLTLVLLFAGCAGTPRTEQEEYEYQNKVIEFKEWAARCIAMNHVIFLDNPVGRYPKGIDKHPSPNQIDMATAKCVSQAAINRAFRDWERAR